MHSMEMSESGLWEIEVSREKIQGMLEELQERKVVQLDGVLGHVLSDCRQQLSGPIGDNKICIEYRENSGGMEKSSSY